MAENHLQRWLHQNKYYRWFILKAKKTSFPGLSGVPIYHIVIFIYREAVRDDIITRANSMAFSFFISLFPALLILISISALLPFDIMNWLKSALANVMPEDAQSFLFQIIGDLEALPHGGLLSVGFFLAIYFSSNGVRTMLKGFEKNYTQTFTERSWLSHQFVGVLLTLILFILLILASILVIVGNIFIGRLIEYLQIDGFESFLVQFTRWFLTIFLIYSFIAAIYKIGPPLKRKFRFFSPGATIATLSCILLTTGFSIYVNNFGTYNKLYGSIGALIVIMIWIQLNCIILLLGFELNASIAVNRDLLEEHEKINGAKV